MSKKVHPRTVLIKETLSKFKEYSEQYNKNLANALISGDPLPKYNSNHIYDEFVKKAEGQNVKFNL